jgi:hypothetical protein
MEAQNDLQKIQALLESGNGENNFIAIHLLAQLLEVSIEEALLHVKPTDYSPNKAKTGDLYLSYRIASVHVNYESVEGYIPYMDSGKTTTRVVGIKKETFLDSLDGLSEFLFTDEDATEEEIRQHIKEDFKNLIPTILPYIYG